MSDVEVEQDTVFESIVQHLKDELGRYFKNVIEARYSSSSYYFNEADSVMISKQKASSARSVLVKTGASSMAFKITKGGVLMAFTPNGAKRWPLDDPNSIQQFIQTVLESLKVTQP